MSRGTRGRMRMQPQPNEEDDLMLMLSQSLSSTRQLDGGDDDDDDFHLRLSQSQLQSKTLGELDDSTVSDLANSTASVQNNIKLIARTIKQNHDFLVKQNDMLLNLISDISVNVSDINEKVIKLERKFLMMNKTVSNTNEVLSDVTNDVAALKKAMKVMKQKQAKTIASDEYEERLKHAERKLKLLENKRETESAPLSDGNLYGSAASVIIRNLPYGMKDAEDCHQMLHDGLGLDLNIKSTQRAPSVNNNAGVLTIELHNNNDKEMIMNKKSLLRLSEKYYNVYIDESSTHVHQIIERKLKILAKNLQNTNSFPRSSEYRGMRHSTYDDRRYRKRTQPHHQ